MASMLSSNSNATHTGYDIALWVLQKMSCILSAIGSLMILSQASRSEYNRRKTQQRIMLGISAVDFQTSVVWIFTSLFVPEDSGALRANGNRDTCNAQGFLVQFSTAGILYMCSLQLQYLLVVNYKWKADQLLKVEKWFHLVPILFGLGTATAALVLKQYSPANWDCWIAPSPPNCTSSYEVNRGRGNTNLTETDCVRGDNADFYRWAFFFGPLWASIAFCISVMFLIYKKVSKTERRSNTYRTSWVSRESFRAGGGMKSADKGSASEEVKKQSYYYSCAFFIVWTFPTIARIIQVSGSEIHPVLGVLAGSFIGLQGFLNALIYFRPRYNTIHYDKWYRKVWVLVHSTLFFCFFDDDHTKDNKDVVGDKTNPGEQLPTDPAPGEMVAQNEMRVRHIRLDDVDCEEEGKREEG